MKIALRHVTRLDYDAEVVEGVMDVRLGPYSDEHQRWEQFELCVEPSGAIRRYEDGFGNSAHLVTVVRPHDTIELVTEGEVETILDNPFDLPPLPPRPLSPAESLHYLKPSALVHISPDVAAMAADAGPSDPALTFEAVGRLMNAVHDRLAYKKFVTTVATTVSEVLNEGAGVCQDFAHVMAALCRAIAVPSRYVSGYIVQPTITQAQTLGGLVQSQALVTDPWRGDGASHAWIEAWTPTHGWRGFDATNNLVASTHHVKMATGRDYADVPPTRGSFRGAAMETLTVQVKARALD